MQCQGELHYAIIDEVDSILIDEARTPLIISGPAFDDVRKYAEADRIARLLRRDVHFEVKEKERTCHLNDEGIREAEQIAGVESFYTPGNMEWPHLIDNSLKAHHLYQPRPRLRRPAQRRDRHRRRVHRPADDRPAVVRRPAPGGRGQGAGQDQGREPDPRHDHAPELLQALQEALGHDRHGHDRGERVLQGLQPRRVAIPTNRP